MIFLVIVIVIVNEISLFSLTNIFVIVIVNENHTVYNRCLSLALPARPRSSCMHAYMYLIELCSPASVLGARAPSVRLTVVFSLFLLLAPTSGRAVPSLWVGPRSRIASS